MLTKKKLKYPCYECGEPVLGKEDHATMQVYDSPWGASKEITVHVDDERKGGAGHGCLN